MSVPEGDLYQWDPKSTYVKSFLFRQHAEDATRFGRSKWRPRSGDSRRQRDHRHLHRRGWSRRKIPGRKWAKAPRVARRGNHEVMMRGNLRQHSPAQRAPGTEGSWTLHLPDGEKMFIYDAAVKYREAGVPLGRLVGGKRHAPAGHSRRSRGELRAHSPQQFDRHGRAAAGI